MSYWNHEGKYQAELEMLHQLLVPKMGGCDTDDGNLLAVVQKCYYRFFNDGETISRTLEEFRVWTRDIWKISKDDVAFIKGYAEIYGKSRKGKDLDTFIDMTFERIVARHTNYNSVDIRKLYDTGNSLLNLIPGWYNTGTDTT